MRRTKTIILLLFLSLTSCLDPKSESSSPSLSSESIDDGGRYLKSEFYIADLNGNEISKSQAANFNDILVCDRQSQACESICVNQLFYSGPYKRYSLLWSGYIHGGTCSVYVMGHNDSDNGLPSYKYYSGNYIQSNPPSVVGHCSGISVSSPNIVGRFDFTENRVSSGQPTPDPWGRRLYYALDVFDAAGGPYSRTYIRAYEPVQDSGAVHLFSSLVGGVETTWQSVNGFSCVREDQITDSLISQLH